MAETGHPTIVAGLVARAVATAEACGLKREAFLAELGVEPAGLEDRDNRLPVEKLAAYEVSFLLGYREPATFFRAFKRWTGKTPQQYRASTVNA